ncbi:hypothetical protein CR513_13153, partial [Mucuna pruriens]
MNNPKQNLFRPIIVHFEDSYVEPKDFILNTKPFIVGLEAVGSLVDQNFEKERTSNGQTRVQTKSTRLDEVVLTIIILSKTMMSYILATLQGQDGVSKVPIKTKTIPTERCRL